ncbi:MAG: Asp-tRNA(Asn)/Glu-tRNA(Gln) amidotransferase GatCAB subunit A [Anaerolinea sp.]|nr:Asp-tRNA(Asn)/Glu-tRNA(Gln) amidotransferase GatCAB subunit A [Anaerolinea sp.]
MNPDLTLLSLFEMQAGLRSGKFSCSELLEAHLQRVHALEPRIHAFITLVEDSARAEAQKADIRFAEALETNQIETLPPLLGIPIAVKDLITVKDIRCSCGSNVLGDWIAPFTATAVQHLIDAGAIIVGKTNTDEFAMGSSTETSAFGPTFNPWDTTRVPGGSSGGSAAAVAARMVPAAIGSDTGGSIRQPAAFCGVTGIKPSYGRVSRYGLVAYGSSLDSMGAFTRTGAEAALLLGIMAGLDKMDATSADQPVSDYRKEIDKGVKGLRIGVPREYFIEGIQSEIKTTIMAAIETYRTLGAEIVEISLPHTKYALPVYYLIAPAEASANLARYDGVRFGARQTGGSMVDLFFDTRGQGFGSEVKRRIMLGTYALSAGYYDAYYGQAQKVRTLIKQDFEKAFESVDVIACPVTPTTAFKVGEHGDDPLAMYLEDVFTLPANLAGVPGIAFPVGLDSNMLPIGMQLMGKRFNEEMLFQAVHAFQQTTKFHLQSPVL